MRCIVPTCNHDSRQNSKSQNITFHLLPTDPSRRAAWFKALGKVNLSSIEKSAVICSSHFLAEDMYISRGRCRLRMNAVPVLNQNSDGVFDCLVKPCEVDVSRLQGDNMVLTKCRDVKTCRVCLATDCKLYHTSLYNSLERAYETLTGLLMNNGEHLPPYLCGECARRLLNCVHFRNRCLRTRMVLVEIAKEHTCLTLNAIKSINRNCLKSNLGVTHNQPDYYDMDIEYMKEEHKYTDTQIDDHEYKQEHIQTDDQDLNEIKVEDESFEYDHLSEETTSKDRITIDLLNELKTEVIDGQDGRAGGNDRSDEFVVNKHVYCDNKSVGEDMVLLPKTVKIMPSRVRMKKKNIQKNLKIPNKRGRKRKAPAEQNLQANENNKKDSVKVYKSRKKTKRRENGVEDLKESGDKENCEELTDCGENELQLLKKKQTRSLNLMIFTVTELTLEQQMQEVEARQHLPQYLNAPYKCAVCYRGYNVKYAYEVHLVKHHEVSGNHVCTVCRVRTLSANALRNHMAASHRREYNCNLCEFVSRRRGAALQHQDFHAGIVYECAHCPMSFNNCTTYQNHLRIKHRSQFVCALCGYTFVNTKGLLLHKKLKHRIAEALVIEGPYCETCDVQFISELAYQRHLTLSSKHCSDDDPFRISNDPQTMWADERRSRNQRLPRRTSIRKRSTPKVVAGGPVECEQCGEKLKNLRVYAQHFRYEHPGKNRTQFSQLESCCMCEMCGHVTHCNAVLMEHMWIQHGVGDWRPRSPQPERPRKAERPTFQCPTCAKCFTLKYNYQRHLFNHTDQRPFKCDQCTKSFRTRAEKRTHVEHTHHKKPWPKRKCSRKQDATKTSVLCEEQRLRGNRKSASVSYVKRRGLRKINKGVSVFSAAKQRVGEVDEGASVVSDVEQCFKEVDEGFSVISDGEQHFKEVNEEDSMISDDEQDFKKVNEGDSLISDGEYGFEQVIEGGSVISDAEEGLGDDDETCIIEYVLDDEQDALYESSDEFN